jgi:peptide/nickel transport system substrate-binding protein
MRHDRSVTRRDAIRWLGFGVATAALSACGGLTPAPPAPQQPAAAPTSAAPAAVAPTAVPTSPPAPTAAPVPTLAVQQATDAGFLRPAGTPQRGGTLKLAFGVTIPHYDITQGAGSSILCHMYSNLVRRNPLDGLRTIIPDLAVNWETSADGLTYTFHLRQGVQFHDGTPFGADDVVASFSRVINPPTGIVSPNKQTFSMVKEVKKVDATTMQFVLNQPSAIFLQILTDPGMVIYAKKTLDANNQDLRKVVAPGTGAFMYKEYREAEKWTFVRNPNYWDKELPYLDTLELLHVPNWPDRGTAVLTAQADMSWNVSHDTWLEGQKRTDIVQVGKIPSFGAYAVFLNTTKKPFDNPLVRRAVHLAVSRPYLIQAFITQEAIDLTRWVPHGDANATPLADIQKLPGYREDKTADVAEAKKLMEQAGYKDGFDGVDFLSASVPAHAQIMAPAIQEQLKSTLNIGVKIRVQERALLAQQERSGDFGMVLDTPGGPLPDVSPIAHLFWAKDGSQNWGKYSNPKFDDLLTKSDVETDSAKRKPMLDQMQELLDQDPPWLLVGYTFHQTMWRSYVHGLELDKRIMVEWGRVEPAWVEK